jgi:hypothetical protein
MTELAVNPRFPPELVDSIFSFLRLQVDYDEGFATLKRCSTDPVLCQFAEKHIYSTIGVFMYPGDFDADLLAALFSKQPHIAHYVRNIKIIVTYPPPNHCLDDILSRVLCD